MKLDNHSSSQLNATADDSSSAPRRSKNPQDVVFVDEDGNPIEAGHENLMYVDESGHEIPEEIAMQLLETGKYVDSRDLYVETPTANNESNQPRSSNATFLSNASASNTTPAGNGSGHHQPPHSASLPASAFGSLSKASGARQQRDLQQASDVLVRKAASSQILLQATSNDVATRTQTQHSSFVTNEPTATARSYQRDKELDQVELDNVSFRLDASELEKKQSNNNNYIKSVSNVDMQKSQSARRLIQPPPKRTDTRQSNDSYATSSSQRQSYRYQQASPSTAAAVAAPSCQTYNLNQLVESPITPQPTSSAQQRQQQQHLPSQSPYVSSAYEYQPSENNLTQQQYEYEDDEANREEEAAYEDEQQQQLRRQQDITDNEILRSSSQPPESPYYYDQRQQSQQSQQSQQQQRQPSRLSQYSQASRSTNSRPLTNQRLTSAASSHPDLLGQFQVVQFRRLGDLRGDQIIRDISQLTDEDINRLYSLNEDQEDDEENNENQFIDPADPNLFKDEIVDIDFGAIDAYTSALNAQISSVNNDNSAAAGNDLQFPSHILTSSHATFLDNQLLLGDAYYGRDDDVTTDSAANAANETNGDDNASNADAAGAASACPAGFSVQLLNSFKDFENFGGGSGGQTQEEEEEDQEEDDLQSNGHESNNHNEAATSNINHRENAEYSNSHSFGSVVDIDNGQPGYTIGDLSNFNISNLNLNSSHQNYELLDPNNNAKSYNAKPSSRQQQQQQQQQPTSSSGVFYLNSENQENCYVR